MGSSKEQIQVMFNTAYSLGTGAGHETAVLLVAAFKDLGKNRQETLNVLGSILKDTELFSGLVQFLMNGMRNSKHAHQGLLEMQEGPLTLLVANNLRGVIQSGVEICERDGN